MKTKQQKSSQLNECPYIHDSCCGRPDKDPLNACASWQDCISYKFLEETKLFWEEKKDGKQNS